MNTRQSLLTLAALTGVIAIPFTAATSEATSVATATYEVTVTNLTAAQIMSPVLLVNHDDTVDVFEPGQAASTGLGQLAEEGDASLLMDSLTNDPGVGNLRLGTGALLPGASETLTFDASGRFVSLASMLVTTNDAFAGIDSFRLPTDSATLNAVAYDAGTERNSELCEYIPGPPCMSAGAHDPAPAEGHVFVHQGFRGVGSLGAHRYDWRNPVARVVIRRVH